jgi:hypothetical protein
MACLAIFLWVADLCFCRGFWRKRVAKRGFSMVNLWWNRGELWFANGRIPGAKNMPQILDLFLRSPVFGMVKPPVLAVGRTSNPLFTLTLWKFKQSDLSLPL